MLEVSWLLFPAGPGNKRGPEHPSLPEKLCAVTGPRPAAELGLPAQEQGFLKVLGRSKTSCCVILQPPIKADNCPGTFNLHAVLPHCPSEAETRPHCAPEQIGPNACSVST